MSRFEEWFTRQLRVNRYPVPGEIKKMPTGAHVINVSDEWIPSCHEAALQAQVFYHWLPLNECVGHLGVNSIYGALQLLHYAEQQNAQVLLHCHAGAYRSPLVAQAYYFMRTGRHFVKAASSTPEIDNWLGITPAQAGQQPLNTLRGAIDQGLLPWQFEDFLMLYGESLQKVEITCRGGLLTSLKHTTGIQ